MLKYPCIPNVKGHTLMNMNLQKKSADDFLHVIMKCMMILLSVMALYILCFCFNVVENPAETLTHTQMVPEMIEHLLAGCAVSLGLGAAFEYLSLKD